MSGPQTPVAVIVDDDESLRRSVRNLLMSVGFRVETFSSAEAFLQSDRRDRAGCLAIPRRRAARRGETNPATRSVWRTMTMMTMTPTETPSQSDRASLSVLPLARLRRVTDYIQEHLDEDLRLAQLGSVVYMSPYHFARLFQHSTGLPPHRFVVRTRVDRAIRLLAARELPISRIARLVGFRTPSHFSTVFRRLTGTTPGAYRAALLQTSQSRREGA
jgi:AraC-like DNA-binding protein